METDSKDEVKDEVKEDTSVATTSADTTSVSPFPLIRQTGDLNNNIVWY